eukprot:gene12028-14212_t
MAYAGLNDHDGAIVSFKDALEIRERELGHVSLDVGQTVMNLAGAFTGTGFYAEAEPLLLRAMDIHRKNNIGAKDPLTAQVMANLGVLRFKNQEYKEALETFNDVLEIRVDCFGRQHILTQETEFNLKKCEAKLKEEAPVKDSGRDDIFAVYGDAVRGDSNDTDKDGIQDWGC